MGSRFRPQSHLALRQGAQIEANLRRSFEEVFFDQGGGVIACLDGFCGAICQSHSPQLALRAALWLFCTWSLGKNPPTEVWEQLAVFLERKRLSGCPHTEAFRQGLCAISVSRAPVTDVSMLYV